MQALPSSRFDLNVMLLRSFFQARSEKLPLPGRKERAPRRRMQHKLKIAKVPRMEWRNLSQLRRCSCESLPACAML